MLEDRLAAATCMAISDEIGRTWRKNPGFPTNQIIEKAFETLRSF